MPRCASCQCSITFKIFLSAAILYLLISVSLMIPSLKEYNALETQLQVLEKRQVISYKCWEICDPLYTYSNSTDLCCNDVFFRNCHSKQQCKEERVSNITKGQKLALFDLEIGVGVTLLFFIILLIIFRKKYKYFLGRQMDFPEGIDNFGDQNQTGSINSSLISKESQRSVYKSFIQDVNGEFCVICYQDFIEEKLIKLTCNHIFHAECIRSWLEKKNDCPVCRAGA